MDVAIQAQPTPVQPKFFRVERKFFPFLRSFPLHISRQFCMHFLCGLELTHPGQRLTNLGSTLDWSGFLRPILSDSRRIYPILSI